MSTPTQYPTIKSERSQSVVKPEELIKPVIIACTALVNEEVRLKTFEAGFDAVYQVPLNSDQIRDEIVPMIQKKIDTIVKKEIFHQKLMHDLENQVLIQISKGQMPKNNQFKTTPGLD